MSNYTAQNIGAGKMERVRQGFHAGVKLVWSICIPVVILYWFGAGMLINFFVDEPSDLALNTGILFLRILSPFYFIVSVKLVLDGILRGASMMTRFMIATCTDLVVRLILALLFAKPFGVTGVWSAWPFGWLSGFVLMSLFYRKGPWMEKNAQLQGDI